MGQLSWKYSKRLKIYLPVIIYEENGFYYIYVNKESCLEPFFVPGNL